LALGAGEAINEKACTGIWPSPKERVERLEEAVRLIKKCWTATDYFTFNGKFYKTKFFLYDKPKKPIPLYIAAEGLKMARIAGKYGDGIISYSPPERIKDIILPEFDKAAKEAGKDPATLERIAFVGAFSYHPDIDKAIEIPKRYAGTMIDPKWVDIEDPRIFESQSLALKDYSKFTESALIATTAEVVIERIEKYIEIGFNHIILEETSYDPWLTPKIFKEKILPHFKD